MSATMSSTGGGDRGGTGTGTGKKRQRDQRGDDSASISPEGEDDDDGSSSSGRSGVSRRRRGQHDEHRGRDEDRTHLLRAASELNDVGASLYRLGRLQSAAEFYRSGLAAAAEAEGGGGGGMEGVSDDGDDGEGRNDGAGASTTSTTGGDEDHQCRRSHLGRIREGREMLAALLPDRERRDLGDDGEDGEGDGEGDRDGGPEGGLRLHRTILLGDPLPIDVVDDESDDDDTAPSVAAAVAMHNLGVVHCLMGQLDRSADMFESALNLLSATEAEADADSDADAEEGAAGANLDPRPMGGPPHLYPVLMNNIGHVYHLRGRTDEAAIAFGEALRLGQEALDLLDLEEVDECDGESDQDCPVGLKGGGPCERGEVQEDCVGAEHEDEDEGECDSDQDCSDALKGGCPCERGEVREDAVGADDGDEEDAEEASIVAAVRECAATVLYNKGHLHYRAAAGERDLAAECFVDALEYATSPSLLLNVVVHLNYIGRECHRTGRTDEALRLYREALAVRTRIVEEESPSSQPQTQPQPQPQRETRRPRSTLPAEVYSNMLLNVGYIHFRSGRFEPAREAFVGSLGLLREALGESHPLVVRLTVHTKRVLAGLCGGAGSGSGGGSTDDNIAAAA